MVERFEVLSLEPTFWHWLFLNSKFASTGQLLLPTQDENLFSHILRHWQQAFGSKVALFSPTGNPFCRCPRRAHLTVIETGARGESSHSALSTLS
jgi:hypothetical protein